MAVRIEQLLQLFCLVSSHRTAAQYLTRCYAVTPAKRWPEPLHLLRKRIVSQLRNAYKSPARLRHEPIFRTPIQGIEIKL